MVENEASSRATFLEAVWDGRIDVVRRMLEGGISPDQVNDGGVPAIHYTTRQGLDETAALRLLDVLLTAGADVELRDPEDFTALHMAVFQDRVVLAARLLDAGARHDVRDHVGRTPLHLARSSAMVELLRGRGADLRARSDDGSTPHDEALAWGHSEAAAALARAEAGGTVES